MKVQEALNFILKQGWDVQRKTSHGYMLRRKVDGITVPFAYISHSKEIGATQMRMLSKKFELSPSLIDEHLQPKETTPLTINPAVSSSGLKMTPMNPKEIGWRVSQAMLHAPLSDDQLAQFMGRDIPWVVDLKKGRIELSDAELTALVGVFGRTADGKISTRWYQKRKGSPGARPRGTMGGPPLMPAPWVLESERNKQRAAAAKPVEQVVADAGHTVVPDTSPRTPAVQPTGNGEAASKEESLIDRVEAAEKQIQSGIDDLFKVVNEMMEEREQLQKSVRDESELDAALELLADLAAKRKQG